MNTLNAGNRMKNNLKSSKIAASDRSYLFIFFLVNKLSLLKSWMYPVRVKKKKNNHAKCVTNPDLSWWTKMKGLYYLLIITTTATTIIIKHDRVSCCNFFLSKVLLSGAFERGTDISVQHSLLESNGLVIGCEERDIGNAFSSSWFSF